MGRSLRVFLVVVSVVAACQFPAPPDVPETDGPIDTPEIDRPPTPARLEAAQDLHDFGGVVIGGSSATFGVMVQNTGDLPAGAIGLSLTGAELGEFEIVPTGDTSDCAGKALAGSETCRAQVRYRPQSDQTSSASLVIAADPGGSVAVPVTGDALTPARLTSLTSTESFGGVVVGSSSTVHHITIQNDGEQSTGVLGVTKSGPNQGEFAVIPVATDDCQGATLGQQGTCQIDVRFTPGMPGAPRTAIITVGGTPGGLYPITVTGDGLNPGDLAIEQPTGGATLDFGARDLGSGATSTPQTIRVRNTGGVATGALVVTITGAAGPSYQLPLDGCNGNPLGAGAACDIAVRFNPAAIGAQPATVQIRDNASGGTQAVNVTGVGTGSIALTKVGMGTVVSAPAGISCNGACPSQTGSFSSTPVSLTATADPGWTFDSWGGACAAAGAATVCSVAVAQALTNVSATFRQLFTLTLSTTGSGAVTSNPFGITCGTGGTDCSEPYLVGTNVQLTADPDPGYEVASWTGSGVSCGPAQRTCAVSMTQARTVAVEFRPLRTLTVSTVGSGVGTITGGGITCQSPGTGTCTAQVIDGTPVTLTRIPAAAPAGSQHALGNWGGACAASGAASTCSFAIAADMSVTGAFVLRHQLTLTIISAGGGSGSLTAQPGSFACSVGTCTQYFDAGASVDVAAMPAGATDGLLSITGDCTSSPCAFSSLSAPKTVTATFQRVSVLSIGVSGFGDVVSTPAGIRCGVTPGFGACTWSFPAGSTVALAATPNTGWEVTSWGGGGCAPGEHSCMVDMSASRNVGVVFTPIPTVPILATPLNNAYVGSVHAPGSRRMRFTWLPSGLALGGDLTYDLQYSSDPAFQTGVVAVPGLADTSFQVTTDLAISLVAPVGRRYFWRVRACSALLCSAYSGVYAVNVGRNDADLDGDGYAELVVTSPRADVGGVDTGKLYVYRGSATGLAFAGSTVGVAQEQVASSVATGDVNGDGFADLVVGVRSNGAAGAAAGRVSVYLGASAFDLVSDLDMFGTPSEFFGSGVAIGDVNADGYADIVVRSTGSVRVFHGESALDGTADRTYTGGGTSDPVVGDVSGDGYADLLLPAGGRYRVYRGSGGSLATVPDAATLDCEFAAAVGDVGGDGAVDLACRRVDAASGLASPVLVMFGYRQALPEIPLDVPLGTSWDYPSADSIGDANGDGRLDFAIGQAPPGSPGRIVVHFGGTPTDGVADAVYGGAMADGRAGAAICGGGDVNGDGVADFADGATGERLNPMLAAPGRVHVFQGVAATVMQPYDLIVDFAAEGESNFAEYGARCSL